MSTSVQHQGWEDHTEKDSRCQGTGGETPWSITHICDWWPTPSGFRYIYMGWIYALPSTYNSPHLSAKRTTSPWGMPGGRIGAYVKWHQVAPPRRGWVKGSTVNQYSLSTHGPPHSIPIADSISLSEIRAQDSNPPVPIPNEVIISKQQNNNLLTISYTAATVFASACLNLCANSFNVGLHTHT